MTEPNLGPATAGGMLRAAREKQGLHIAALAAAIKVSPRKLDALENDRHDELPDATFVRALAQTVCRSLKIDARPVLELLPPAAAVALGTSSEGLGTPFRERPGRVEPGLSAATVRPLVWAAGVLLVAAVGVVFLPSSWWQALSALTSPSAPEAVPAPAAVVLVPPALPAASAPVDAAASAAIDGQSPALPTAEAALEPKGETVFSAPPAEAAASDGTAAVAGVLQLRCSEATWVEVRDAQGQLLLSRTVLPGEGVGLDGALPLRVVIGNAAAAQVSFRGQPVNLATRTRDNVARLELK